MNDPHYPENDGKIEPQNNDLRLQEGEEVSLGLPEKPLINAQSTPNTNVDTEIGPQPVIHSPVVTVTKKPMINLSPVATASKVNGMNLSGKQQKALSKLSRMRKHKHWYNFKLVIGTVLVFLLIFNSQFFISQIIYLFNKPAQTNEASTQNQTEPTLPATNPVSPNPQQSAEVVGPQNEISIPKIGVTAPLVFIDTNSEIDVLRALRDGVVHYYGTALPGEAGNSVFFGHSSNDWWEAGNYKFVFVLLEKLAPGDTYEIHYNSRKYVYTVTETKIVPPTDLSVLNQTSEPTSTLITCTPPGTSWRRFIVFAKQTSPAPTPSNIAAQPPQQAQEQANNESARATLPSAPPTIWDQITSFFRNLFGGEENKPNDQQPSSDSPQLHLPEVN